MFAFRFRAFGGGTRDDLEANTPALRAGVRELDYAEECPATLNSRRNAAQVTGELTYLANRHGPALLGFRLKGQPVHDLAGSSGGFSPSRSNPASDSPA